MGQIAQRLGACWTSIGIALLLVTAAPASAAFPGANGRVAFQGYQSLASINSVGGDRRPLTTEMAVFATPAFSADGQRLAFVTNRDGADFEIYVMGADGGPLTPLTANTAEDGGPSWSPDGRRIAFESDRDGNPEIYVMNADGGGVMRLTSSILDERSPSWSPDGNRIAFTRAAPGAATGAIWTMTPDGGNQIQLTNGATNDDNPDWSPDGGRIAFQRDAGIVVMASSGGGQTPLPLPGGGARPAWAPDGARIAFDLNLELFAANADGSAVSPLTSAGSSTLVAQGATWQPIPAPAGGTSPPPPPGAAPSAAPRAGAGDADGDGVLRPADCRDDDPKIHPGADDIPGDRIDQDCRGGDAQYPQLDRTVTAFSLTKRGFTVFTSMVVKPARKGDVLKLECRGRGCPFKAKSLRVKKDARSLSLLPQLRRAKLRKGAVLQLQVTRAATVSRIYRWAIRAPKLPGNSRRCLPPGATKPSACPT